MKPTKEEIEAASGQTGRHLAHAAMIRLLFEEVTRLASPNDQLKRRNELLKKTLRMIQIMPLDGVEQPDLVRHAGAEEVQAVFGTSLN